MNYIISTIMVCFVLLFSCQDKTVTANVVEDEPLFALLPASETGIDFNNQLTEALNTNVLMYEYFYNGGGVAIGDLNGDDLEDVYFTANMTDNKLYLNKGNLKFEDITKVSQVQGRPGPWKTGTTLVDINGDNKLDIFVCYSGKLSGKKRIPQLFINQGNNEDNIPVFKDEAIAYGITDSTFCTQAYFFDYDRDGDLDMLQLNHNPTRIGNIDDARIKSLIAQKNSQYGTRLLKNVDNKFVDVSSESGIVNSTLSYNLGASITDINNDGWPDVYIANDYLVPDYLYINNGDGTFTNNLGKSMGHTSQFSMGNDAADINNDGLTDIISLDMLPEDNRRQKLLFAPDNYEEFDMIVRSGFHRQFMRNMLQLNNGDGTFSEIGQLSGISNTDWSWGPLMADYDNDGWKDLFVTNGYLRDYTNMDFLKFMTDYLQQKGTAVYRRDLFELVQKIPASNIVNYIYKNKGDLQFENKQKDWGINQPSNSNGAAYSDLDNDGDLDLVINNINNIAFVYKNNASKENSVNFIKVKLKGTKKNTQGIGAKVYVYSQGNTQLIEQMPERGFQSSVSPTLHFGVGSSKLIDSVKVNWLSGVSQTEYNVKAGNSVVFDEKVAVEPEYKGLSSSNVVFSPIDSPVDYQHVNYSVNDFKRQPLLVNPLSFQGPFIKKSDINQDGLEDIFIGGGHDQPAQVFIQNRNGSFKSLPQPAFHEDRKSTDADALFFDANGDGKLDVYIVSGGYNQYMSNDPLLEDRLYLNDGQSNFVRVKNALPKHLVSGSCVKSNDINGDGLQDLFVGAKVVPGRYPEIPESRILINDGKGHFIDQTNALASGIENIGMVTDAVWVDLNNDKKDDLIVVGEWMPITVFVNHEGKLTNRTSDYFDKEYSGWWNTINTGDYNNDGITDIVLGNMGLNTQCKVSFKEPAELFYKDFDSNGAIDPIFCSYIQGTSYPCVSRDELLDQIPSMRTKYPDYKSYANVRFDDLFTDDQKSGMKSLQVNCLETVLFKGNEQHRFSKVDLPIEVQFAPIYSIADLDFDKDGDMDLLLSGNINNARLRFGNSDANYGVLLENDGKGNFTYINQQHSGLQVKGDVRSTVVLSNYVLFGVNQRPLVAYKF
ncbi:VCBS repeat-containing protein [Aestuariivivens insulae]|uniref:VCBS repeat-containing protein n=1 Tax=Aestuariivivens insulae TaxID=1621988 RepID=UPI001F5A22C8|nr:VCBS repeat-containing protein [Aestuariivivens insulae]